MVLFACPYIQGEHTEKVAALQDSKSELFSSKQQLAFRLECDHKLKILGLRTTWCLLRAEVRVKLNKIFPFFVFFKDKVADL